MAWYRYEVTLTRNDQGRFGFSFDILPDGTYEISDVFNGISDLKRGDELKSINGVTKDLKTYCSSQEASLLQQWLLVVERGGADLQMPSQSSPTTLGPRLISDSGSSLDLSFFSGSGTTLPELAVEKPNQIIWSNELKITYHNASHIDITQVKFKKKETLQNPKEWILLIQIMHTRDYPYAYAPQTNTLQVGDWVLRVNNTALPFFCKEGTTTWFKRKLIEAGNQSITITVKRPYTSKQDILEYRDPLDSGVTIQPSLLLSDLPKSGPVLNILSPGHLSNPEPPKVNENDVKAGIDIIKKCRCSIQSKSIDKLGRCRLIFHHVNDFSNELTEHIQSQIFGISRLPQTRTFGNSIKEYHLHATISESGGNFMEPTSEDCRDVCSFEMHETLERIWEKTVRDSSSRRSIERLPNDLYDGPVSIQSLKRMSSTPEALNANKMHLEVLSLTGPSANNSVTWCSPIIFCRYSINIVITDIKALQTTLLEECLSRTLCDIKAHSGWDYNLTTDQSSSFGGRVLLVLINTPACKPQEVAQLVNHKLDTYSAMLIHGENGFPFVICSDIREISDALFRELHLISENAAQDNNPHAGVMLSQKLRNLDVVGIDDFRKMLQQSVEFESVTTPSPFQMLEDGALRYLKNTGLAYIPGLSYSTAIGRGCPTVLYTSIIHPHRLVDCISRLVEHRQNPGDRGRASRAVWTSIMSGGNADKIFDILRELHIILPTYIGNEASNHVGDHAWVLPLAAYNPISNRCPDSNPQLMLWYNTGLNFLLLTAFLNYLSSYAVSSNVDYHSGCGIYDIFDHNVQVYRTSNTRFGWRSQQPAAVKDKSLCFFVYSIRPTGTSHRGFAAKLKDLVTKFHSAPSMSSSRPLFGPPCPLEERCNHGSFHIIDMLGNCIRSCSGQSLERIAAVTNYVSDGRYDVLPGRDDRRSALLDQPASSLPSRIIEQLDEYSPLERNWIGLARLANLSPRDIDKLKHADSPSTQLLLELSTNRGYTIENLFAQLFFNMENLALMEDINNWIDLECTK
ncbi:uncharacterized protein [Watersipora subatra]|uniref:uncharacterized protein isoform X2 n=1 Tax=Watersipora subatra TaxID=2589382 RepID=UPI00355C4A66